jgi:hypothetical protein
MTEFTAVQPPRHKPRSLAPLRPDCPLSGDVRPGLEAPSIHAFSQVRVHGDRMPPASTIVTGEPTDQDTNTATPTRTIDGGVDAGGNASASATPACRSVSGTASLPAATLLATVTGNKLSASWSMLADFTSDPPDPAVCGPCGEYRQYVRGTFTKNGAPVTHRLCGTNLDPTTFQEDCAQIGGTQYKYGYHSIPFGTSRFSRPDQATGQRWDGYDAPGISGSSGDSLTVNLDFQGTIIDTCNSATLGGSAWSVAGSATLP